MVLRNISDNVQCEVALAPAVRLDGSSQGASVDMLGFDSAAVIVSFGNYTDGTHTPVLQESDDGITFANVDESDLTDAFAVASDDSADYSLQQIGYAGFKRYLRVVLTVTDATSGALSAAYIIKGHAHVI